MNYNGCISIVILVTATASYAMNGDSALKRTSSAPMLIKSQTYTEEIRVEGQMALRRQLAIDIHECDLKLENLKGKDESDITTIAELRRLIARSKGTLKLLYAEPVTPPSSYALSSNLLPSPSNLIEVELTKAFFEFNSTVNGTGDLTLKDEE